MSDDRAVVRVRTVRTRNGVRLEIAAPASGRAIRLCPLELETLTWQTHEGLAALRPPGGDPAPPGAAILQGELSGDAAVELANEYAAVSVRRVGPSGEERVEIVAQRIGRGIRLAADELETLAGQPHETFSRFLQTPFGPEAER